MSSGVEKKSVAEVIAPFDLKIKTKQNTPSRSLGDRDTWGLGTSQPATRSMTLGKQVCDG